MNQRLIHDAAVAMAQSLLDLMKPSLREEERIEAYEIQLNRMRQRLKPLNN